MWSCAGAWRCLASVCSMLDITPDEYWSTRRLQCGQEGSGLPPCRQLHRSPPITLPSFLGVNWYYTSHLVLGHALSLRLLPLINYVLHPYTNLVSVIARLPNIQMIFPAGPRSGAMWPRCAKRLSDSGEPLQAKHERRKHNCSLQLSSKRLIHSMATQ